MVIFAGTRGYLDEITIPQVGEFESGLLEWFRTRHADQLDTIRTTGKLGDEAAFEAAIKGDPELVVAACALDPLTSACLTLKEVRDMAADMLEAERQWLPQFKGKTIRTTPVIKTPKGTRHAEVPLDPALAVVHRFGELAHKAGG